MSDEQRTYLLERIRQLESLLDAVRDRVYVEACDEPCNHVDLGCEIHMLLLKESGR